MLPQINADQRRKNLRNSATSAGDLSGTGTTPTRGPAILMTLVQAVYCDGSEAIPFLKQEFASSCLLPLTFFYNSLIINQLKFMSLLV